MEMINPPPSSGIGELDKSNGRDGSDKGEQRNSIAATASIDEGSNIEVVVEVSKSLSDRVSKPSNSIAGEGAVTAEVVATPELFVPASQAAVHGSPLHLPGSRRVLVESHLLAPLSVTKEKMLSEASSKGKVDLGTLPLVEFKKFRGESSSLMIDEWNSE